MTAYNTATEDDKGRQIKPVLFNTAKDGSGTFYYALVNSDGVMEVTRVGGGVLSSGVKTADVAVKASAGAVYWLTVSDTAAGVIGLADSLTNSTTYVWKITIPADGYAHLSLTRRLSLLLVSGLMCLLEPRI